VLGDGILYKEFKRFNFTTLDGDNFKVDCTALNMDYFHIDYDVLREFDTIINTYDRKENESCGNQGMYVYNTQLPNFLSAFCSMNNKTLVHISTGDLYDNSLRPQSEDAVLGMKTSYHATKFLGETYCPKKSLIIRTKNIFNNTLEDDNALFTLIKDTSNIDIPVSFTHTTDIIRSVTKLLKEKETGIFNVTSNGLASPYEISPSAEYLKRSSISELNLTSNQVTILNNAKLFRRHVTQNTKELLLDCFSEIIVNLKSF